MPFIGGVDFSAFLNQPLDEIVNQLIWMFGWVPIIIALAIGLMQTWVEIQRKHWRSQRRCVLLAIDVPRLTEQSPKAVENIFAITVALKSSPVWLESYLQGKNQWRHSFEIASINGYIQFYIWTEERYRDAYEAAVYSQYPDAEIALVEDYTKAVPHHYPDEQYDLWGSEYVLDRENFYPIRTWEDFEHSASKDEYLKDPLVNLFEGMALMRPGEQMWFQVVTDYADEKWKKEGDVFINKTFGADLGKKKESFLGSGLNMIASIPGTIVGDILGSEASAGEEKKDLSEIYKAFKVTEQEREITKAVVRKIAKPGLRCKIRVIYVARKEIFSKVTRKDIVKGTLKQLQHGDLNKFGGFGSPEDDYWWQVWWYSYHQNRLIEGYVGRSMEIGGKPFVLNTEELATLWHFPNMYVKAPLIKKTVAKRAEPPVETPFASEHDEMLTAPRMHLPEGEGGDAEAAHEVDIFTAPMSVPPIASEIPEELVEPDEQTPHGESSVLETAKPIDDRPMVTSPTANIRTDSFDRSGVAGQLSPKGESVARPTTHDIPDAIKVLIQPGVEPEDVGIRDKIEDDL
ncbi:TPA: hypothetical protein DDZ10_04115 [Candidatus Uhrbacteria bacterium]|nr:MAG: hypothetical protein A3D69_00440 [Candidatus Uhrbacteria bacterium RIFCSPHIGHO2_02_FULL_54_11]HBL39824.1 hypothetical protein [Candidatus Uhrbacteria bacterium]